MGKREKTSGEDNPPLPETKKRTKRIRCGRCVACLRNDCGTCRRCLKPGNKMICFQRRCHQIYPVQRRLDEEAGYEMIDYEKNDTGPTNKPAVKRCKTVPRRKRRDSMSSAASTSEDARKSQQTPHEPKTSFLLQYVEESVQRDPALLRQKIAGSRLYGLDIPAAPRKNVCSGCRGTKNEELKNFPILLCDGPGCEREYHLACCIPPMTSVPETEKWLCFDCSPEGTTSLLREYLEMSDQKRTEYLREHGNDNDNTFVEYLVENDCRKAKLPLECFPLSELARGGTTHALALCDSTDLSRTRGSSEVGPPFVPRDIVGKPLRLYCTLGNEYHTGRIVDYRPYGNTASVSDDSPSLDSTEFLVRFVAGKEGRKTAYHHWIVLEEHPLALGTTLVFAQIPGGTAIWKPAIMWLRTSRELVPVQNAANSPRKKRLSWSESDAWDLPSKTKHTVTALVRTFGQAMFGLVNVRDQAVDLTNESALERYLKEPSNFLPYQMAQIEAKEQKKVYDWHLLPQENPMAHFAISSRDAYNLPTLLPKSMPLLEPPKHCDLCPSILQGLDRSKILQMLEVRGVKPTKDVAASLSCDCVIDDSGVDFKSS